MKKNLTKAKWIKQTEQMTLNYVPGDVMQAKRVFKELTPQEQMTLTKELVETRSMELCRAYKNVINVSYGYGRKRVGKRVIIKKPCVTFIVKKKWQMKKEEDPYEKLPKYLFAYCTVKNERKLCAVETDVEDSQPYIEVRPYASPLLPQQIAVKWKNPISSVTGSITCAIRRSGFNDKTFAMSCRHVFSLSTIMHPQNVVGATIHVGSSNSGKVLGRTLNIKGKLQDSQNGHSFDAQLAEVTELSELRKTIPLNFSGFAKSISDIPKEHWIITFQEKIKAIGPRHIRNLLIDYDRVTASHLVLFEVDALAGEGHSGSPVVSEEGLLLGMLIGGKKASSSASRVYFIPAWQLFDPENYGVASTEDWELVNP